MSDEKPNLLPNRVYVQYDCDYRGRDDFICEPLWFEGSTAYDLHDPDRAPLLRDILVSMKHAAIFLSTREKMHPTGVDLFLGDIERLEAYLRIQGEQQ